MMSGAKAKNLNQTLTEWVEHELSAKGYAIDGPPETIRAMPWSKVTRFTTSSGFIFLKEMAPVFSLEPTLIQTLRQWDGDHLPAIIAINNHLDCFLMKDAGIPLRDHQKGEFQLEFMCKILDVYAKMQLKSAQHIDTLLAIGVPDWCATQLPKFYSQLMTQEDVLKADGLIDLEVKELQGLQGTVTNLCHLLDAHKIPNTVETMDFQDNNILIKDNHLTIADWGDAVISHPFFSLAACLNSAQRNHKLQATEERYKQLQHAYLDNWLEFGSKDELVEAFQLAKTLRTIQVALSFSRAKKGMSLESDHDFKGYMANALRDFMKAVGYNENVSQGKIHCN
jgi:hypothetical protein